MLVFGEPSTGAADDLAKATDQARDMVLRWGMDEALGPVAYARERPVFLTDAGATPTPAESTGAQTAQAIDDAVRALLHQAGQRAITLLTTHRAVLDRCVTELLARETLDEAELAALTGVMKGVMTGALAGSTSRALSVTPPPT